MSFCPIRLLILTSALLTTGCGRYGDFTLPQLEHTAKSLTLAWEVQANPVLSRGQAGEWDAVDALNPSIVRVDGRYYNFYSGFDGKSWHTGLAVSKDGILWQKHGRVLSPDAKTWEGGYIAANGSALRHGHEFLYWYQAGDPPRIGLARSTDGKRWNKLPEPVLGHGPRGSWDERGVADPYVISTHGSFYVFYLGQDRARRQRLGIARSEDGAHWTKLRTNPIMDLGTLGAFDEVGLGEPAVWIANGRYWMLYTGRDKREHRRIGVATSSDGVKWERLPKETVLQGRESWNAKVICDPEVEPLHDGVRVWFGGGDIAHPAENLNGQVGLAVLRLGPAVGQTGDATLTK